MPDAPDAKPLPKLCGTDPWLSTAKVCRYSATVDLPDLSMSSLLITSIGDAVSVSARRMFVPVISTRSTACCALPIPGIANIAPMANA